MHLLSSSLVSFYKSPVEAEVLRSGMLLVNFRHHDFRWQNQAYRRHQWHRDCLALIHSIIRAGFQLVTGRKVLEKDRSRRPRRITSRTYFIVSETTASMIFGTWEVAGRQKHRMCRSAA